MKDHETTGPWKYIQETTKTGERVTLIGGGLVWFSNPESQLRLLDAAPELLAALKALLAHRECPIHSPEAITARLAIRKAEQEVP